MFKFNGKFQYCDGCYTQPTKNVKGIRDLNPLESNPTCQGKRVHQITQSLCWYLLSNHIPLYLLMESHGSIHTPNERIDDKRITISSIKPYRKR